MTTPKPVTHGYPRTNCLKRSEKKNTMSQVIEQKDLLLECPSRLILTGPSGCSKTVTALKMAENWSKLFSKPFSRIIIIYAIYQPVYEQFRNICHDVTMLNGLPENFVSEYLANYTNGMTLLFIDDYDSYMNKSSFCDYFTKYSHHYLCSIIYTIQELYLPYKFRRTICLNATGMLIFKSTRGKVSLKCLAHDLYGEDKLFLVKCYTDACTTPHSYLFLDMTQTCPDYLRVRGNIMPDSERTVYINSQ